MRTPKLIFAPGVQLADLIRALTHTGLVLSNTFDPDVFVIGRCAEAVSANVIPFETPAFLKRQAGPTHD